MPEEPNKEYQKPEKGYSKNKFWRYLIIYIIVGIIIYAIAYFLFLHKGSSAY